MLSETSEKNRKNPPNNILEKNNKYGSLKKKKRKYTPSICPHFKTYITLYKVPLTIVKV